MSANVNRHQLTILVQMPLRCLTASERLYQLFLADPSNHCSSSAFALSITRISIHNATSTLNQLRLLPLPLLPRLFPTENAFNKSIEWPDHVAGWPEELGWSLEAPDLRYDAYRVAVHPPHTRARYKLNPRRPFPIPFSKTMTRGCSSEDRAR